jgi:hypothetical protein
MISEKSIVSAPFMNPNRRPVSPLRGRRFPANLGHFQYWLVGGFGSMAAYPKARHQKPVTQKEVGGLLNQPIQLSAAHGLALHDGGFQVWKTAGKNRNRFWGNLMTLVQSTCTVGFECGSA